MKYLQILFIILLSTHGYSITYQQYIQAIKDLPEVKILQINPRILSNEIQGTHAADDIKMNAQTLYKSSFEGNSFFNPQQYNGIQAKVIVDKFFSSSGSHLQTGIAYQTLNPSNTIFHKPEISISFRQSLWQNWLGQISQYPVDNASVDYQIGLLTAKQQTQDLIYNYSLLYFNYIYLERLIVLQEKEVQNFIRLQQITKQKLRDGLVDQDQYQSAHYQVLSYQENIFTMKKTHAIVSNRLLSISGDLPDPGQWEQFRETIITTNIPLLKFEDTLAADILSLYQSQMELHKTYNKNKAKPALNFLAQLGFFNIDSDPASAWQLSQYPEYYFGLEFNWLPQDSRSKADIKNAELKLKKIDHEIQMMKRNYFNAFFEYKNNLEQITQKLIYNKEQISSILIRKQSELKKYNQGRFSLNDLILTENLLLKEKIDSITLEWKQIEYFLAIQNLTLQNAGE